RRSVLPLRHADRRDHAAPRQGRAVAAPARRSCQLLDRARSPRAGARHDDQPVLTQRRTQMSFLKELVQFLMARKKYWLLPIFLVLFIFGGLTILVKGSAVAPFIYTLFWSSRMRILGISAFYHDSAAALVVDGGIVAAVQEERFTRIKQDAGFPRHAIDY